MPAAFLRPPPTFVARAIDVDASCERAQHAAAPRICVSCPTFRAISCMRLTSSFFPRCASPTPRRGRRQRQAEG